MNEISNLSVNVFQEKVNIYTQALENMATFLPENLEDDKTIEEIFRKTLLNNMFDRLGVVTKNGRAFGYDRTRGIVYDPDFSKKDYFKVSIKGKIYIGKPSEDAFVKNQKIILISVPIYDNEGNICGILCGINKEDKFLNLIDIPFLNGKGVSDIIDSTGNMILKSRKDNYICNDEIKNCLINIKEKDAIVQNLTERKSGTVNVSFKKEKYFVVYKPVNVNDWFLVSVIPKKIMTAANNKLLLFSLIIVLSASCTLLFMGLSILHNKKIVKMKNEQSMMYDQLTNILNKSGFIQKATSIKDLYSGKYLLAIIDIKDFNEYNKVFGHESGDSLLIRIAEFLLQNINSDEICARSYADYFCVLLESSSSKDDEEKIKNLLSTISCSCVENTKSGYEVILKSGLCHVTAQNGNMYEIIEKALRADKSCSLKGNKNIAFYTDSLNEHDKNKTMIESRMNIALKNEEFLLYLQPKYSIENNGTILCGAEALVRWNFNNEKLIFPDSFIFIFEQNGFVTELDMYMLTKVCKQLRAWLDEGKKCVPVSVNQSRLHMLNPDYIHTLRNIVDSYNIPYRLIEFEVTESAVMDDIGQVHKQFSELRKLGFITSMDDFGSGFSSLSLLRDIQTDIIKIDKNFFTASYASEQGKLIVSAMLKMLQSLNYKTIAEGIETAEQVQFLRDCGCNSIQGYYFRKPMPPADFNEEHLFPYQKT